MTTIFLNWSIEWLKKKENTYTIGLEGLLKNCVRLISQDSFQPHLYNRFLDLVYNLIDLNNIWITTPNYSIIVVLPMRNKCLKIAIFFKKQISVI